MQADKDIRENWRDTVPNDTLAKEVIVGAINDDFSIEGKRTYDPEKGHSEFGLTQTTWDHSWRYVPGDSTLFWWRMREVSQDLRDAVAGWLEDKGYGHPHHHRTMLGTYAYDYAHLKGGKPKTHMIDSTATRFLNLLEKKKKKKDFENVTKPDDCKGDDWDQVSLGKDKDGYFVYTHRARSSSYPTPQKIAKTKVKFVASTG